MLPHTFALNCSLIVSQVLVLSSHLNLGTSGQQGLCLKLGFVPETLYAEDTIRCGSHIKGPRLGITQASGNLIEALDLPSAFFPTMLGVKQTHLGAVTGHCSAVCCLSLSAYRNKQTGEFCFQHSAEPNFLMHRNEQRRHCSGNTFLQRGASSSGTTSKAWQG